MGQLPGHDGPQFLSLADSGTLRSPYQPAGSTNLDGLLGTGIYLVVPGESDRTLLGDMIDRFDTVATQRRSHRWRRRTGHDARTRRSRWRRSCRRRACTRRTSARCARVIYNRLAHGMPLQMDSTVLYSEHRDGGPVTAADLTLNTPYNTYLHTGLTPTPICFPSEASLQAALAPTPG